MSDSLTYTERRGALIREFCQRVEGVTSDGERDAVYEARCDALHRLDAEYETDPIQVTAVATTYTVSCLPDGVDCASSWYVTVEYRGRGLWSVKHYGDCLGTDGLWSCESQVTDREDGWLATHRFPLEQALELAKAAAPLITVNGMTPKSILLMEKDRSQ